MNLTSQRGYIQPPNLDDRTWQDMVTELTGLIPNYAPQWTDRNASDLGITLIELFAYLVEGLTYRLNLVPDKNYIAFLNLLGITRIPPTPAQAFLTFTVAPSGPDQVPVPQGTQAQGPSSETQQPVIFETDAPAVVLPINLARAVLIQSSAGNLTYSDVSAALTAAPAAGLIVTVPASPDFVQLCLGFDNLTAQSIALQIQMLAAMPLAPQAPANPTAPITTPPTPAATVQWTYSIWPAQTANPPAAITTPDKWPALPGIPSAPTDPLFPVVNLFKDGTVSFTVPITTTTTAGVTTNAWAAQAPSAWSNVPVAQPGGVPIQTSYYWVGIRITNQANQPAFAVKIGYLLFNAVSAHNALTVQQEAVGTSDGTPFQSFLLQNQPLFQWPGHANPYDHLVVSVGGTLWTQATDFPSGPGNLYRIDPVAGQILFGNYDPTTPAGQAGHGSIPPANAAIVANYRYVAGDSSGNVGPSVIGNLSKVVPNITAVTNLFAAFGGTDEEAIDDTLRRGPTALQSQNRAVAPADYEFLVGQAFPALSTVRCLPPMLQTTVGPTPTGATQPAWNVGDPWTFGGIVRAPGNVNVIIVADQGPDVLSPVPTQDQILDVYSFLDTRRDVAVQLNVFGPRYVPILATIDLRVFASAIANGTVPDMTTVVNDTRNKVVAFLHPTAGGPTGQGWQVGQSLFLVDLFQAIMPPTNVGYIANVTVTAQTPLYFNTSAPAIIQRPAVGNQLGTPASSVRLADYELLCSVQPQNHQITPTLES